MTDEAGDGSSVPFRVSVAVGRSVFVDEGRDVLVGRAVHVGRGGAVKSDVDAKI